MKKENHLEKVEEDEKWDFEKKPVNYISHFATSLQKFRVVYNGTLQLNGIIPNDMMYRGPIFIESLIGILIRFRQHAYAVVGDIKNMFFQIKLHSRDRDMLRLLPFTGEDEMLEEEHMRFTVMPFGLICMPSIAGFCVKYVARQNYCNVSDDTVQRVKQDFYVDDFITSVSTIEDTKRVVTESTKLLATTGFSLTKFACNNRISSF